MKSKKYLKYVTFFTCITLLSSVFFTSCEKIEFRNADEYSDYQTNQPTVTSFSTISAQTDATPVPETLPSETEETTALDGPEIEIMSMSGKILEYSNEGVLILSSSGGNLNFKLDSFTEILGSGLISGSTITIYFYSGVDQAAVKIETPERKNLARAKELMSQMSLEDKVAQMFLVRCPDNALDTLKNYKLGGYVLFSNNVEGQTTDSLKQIIRSYQNASNTKMFIAVDEEGGTVTRISSNPAIRDTKFKSPRELFAEGGLEAIAAETEEKATLLTSLGINLNLAPVCDISQNEGEFMYNRSLGQDASVTSQFVKQTVEISKVKGLGSTLKHFPGYGSNGDTHTAIITDTRSYETFISTDFLPFTAGIEAGAGGVMVSHNIMQCIDENVPASLSKSVHDILRYDMNFSGVIMTDDLAMNAITLYTNGDEAAVAAVSAGNDIICCTDFATQIPAIIEAVNSGRISEQQINDSVTRILTWKLDLKIIS